METCETLKDIGRGGRRHWAVMSHNEAAAASPGAGAWRTGQTCPSWGPCASAGTSPKM